MLMTQLEKFRQAIYDCLGKAKDAVFKLMDAVLTSPSIPSFPKPGNGNHSVKSKK
jgi:hypothetical protein